MKIDRETKVSANASNHNAVEIQIFEIATTEAVPRSWTTYHAYKNEWKKDWVEFSISNLNHMCILSYDSCLP